MKLTIWNSGDSSVGIPANSYELDCPFEKDEDPEVLQEFRQGAIDLYSAYDDCLHAEYDFEYEAREQAELAFEKEMDEADEKLRQEIAEFEKVNPGKSYWYTDDEIQKMINNADDDYDLIRDRNDKIVRSKSRF
jgi:hypothetical protein